VRCVLGFQDIEGLALAYGNQETPKEIVNRCATVAWLKLTSIETAKWASSRCRGAMSPAEFLSLPDFSSGNVHGVHMIKGLGGVFKSSAPHQYRLARIFHS
jgi:hypothetical protein